MDNVSLAETLADTLEQVAAATPEPAVEKVAADETLDSDQVLGFLKFFAVER